MIDKQTGGPAFPVREVAGSHPTHEDMTLRDYFAAKAMQALVGSPLCEATFDVAKKAKDAYQMADAMLSARGTEKAREL